MNRLVLIDGNAVLHRAYHALPPLTNPQGEIVNAVYGFGSVIIKIVHDFQPTHIAVAFDRAAPTFRKQMLESYQAKRPKMDDELISQIDKVHDLVSAFGISIYELDGYEADDVLGSIVQQVQHDRVKKKADTIDQVIIVTGDRDILQLVADEKVFVFMPTKGLSEGKLYGEGEVVERMGVRPTQIPDFKALAGDSSDNYSGVPGIGPKTAVELLKRFGSVERLYKQLNKKTNLPAATLGKLTQGKESALMSYALATIKRDVPLEIQMGKTVFTTLNTPEARDELGKLGFQSLLRRVEGKTKMGKEKPQKKKVETPAEEAKGEQQTLF